MMMKTEELEEFWKGLKLPKVGEDISGKRLPGMPLEMPGYAALDRYGYRHLLIRKLSQEDGEINFRTRGLDVSTSKFKIGTSNEATYVDLTCTNLNLNNTFTVVASDLIQSVVTSNKKLEDTIKSVLHKWRDFWSVRGGGISLEDTLGLFGEVWFMIRWFPTLDSNVVDMWQVLENAMHDFQSEEASVEVKVNNSRLTSFPTHIISGIDQLDNPESGDLYLFSLQVTEDSISSNTLHNIVREIQHKLEDDYRALSEFNEKLLERGYTLDDTANPSRGFRILAERLYKVTDGFPRIVRRSFGTTGPPPGTSGIKYALNTSACERWLVATTPTDGGNPFSSK